MGEWAKEEVRDGGEKPRESWGRVGDEGTGREVNMFTEPENVRGGDEETLIVKQEASGLKEVGGVGRAKGKKVVIGVGEENVINIMKDGR